MTYSKFLLIYSLVFFISCTGGIDTKFQPEERKTDTEIPIEFRSIPQGQYKQEGGKIVTISQFKISTFEITYKQFQMVRDWATNNGYTLCENNNPSPGSDNSLGEEDQPVTKVSWYDCVKWCNAFSELTGKIPYYYLNKEHTKIYRSGKINISNEFVRTDQYCDGFRLPTEAEWEYAYLSGATNDYFWENATEYGLTGSPTNFGWYAMNSTLCSHIVGNLNPNPYGIYDIAGNLWEWVYDVYTDKTNTTAINPMGPNPTSTPVHILKGGSFAVYESFLKYNSRLLNGADTSDKDSAGFRIVYRDR